jgi:hypothetical protein
VSELGFESDCSLERIGSTQMFNRSPFNKAEKKYCRDTPASTPTQTNKQMINSDVWSSERQRE